MFMTIFIKIENKLSHSLLSLYSTHAHTHTHTHIHTFFSSLSLSLSLFVINYFYAFCNLGNGSFENTYSSPFLTIATHSLPTLQVASAIGVGSYKYNSGQFSFIASVALTAL